MTELEYARELVSACCAIGDCADDGTSEGWIRAHAADRWGNVKLIHAELVEAETAEGLR